MSSPSAPPSLLATPRGRATLALLLSVALLDFIDASIVNVALPAMRGDLGFSIPGLQWVLSAYLLTYGGLMLLGGRLADLWGRRRVLVTGTVVFLGASMAAGVAPDAATMVGARLVQGVGAALMLPASLSILTTTFTHPGDRQKALGAWGAAAGLAGALGVLLGGVLSDLLDWRWVFFVNLPVCLIVLAGTFRLVPADGPRQRQRLDVGGAVLVTAAMMLLVLTIVEAPEEGWREPRTVLGLAGAAVLLVLFALVELRHRQPLFPFSILRIKGLVAADLTQVIAMAGFYSMFYFVTLYMQGILGFSPLKAGLAYLPMTLGVLVSAGIITQFLPRTGTRPVIVAGAVLGAVGIGWLSTIPVEGSYVGDLLVPLVLMAFGFGGVFVGVTTAAQAGVPEEQSGLAAAMINSSTWLGGALGVAVLSAVATSTTVDLLESGVGSASALTGGFQDALLGAAVFLVVAGLAGLGSTNVRGTPADGVEPRELTEVG